MPAPRALARGPRPPPEPRAPDAPREAPGGPAPAAGGGREWVVVVRHAPGHLDEQEDVDEELEKQPECDAEEEQRDQEPE